MENSKTDRALAAAFPWLAMALTAATMIWTVKPSFIPGIPLFSYDSVGHLLRADYWVRNLFIHGFFSGWFPCWNGGFPLYHTAPPLTSYLLGGLDLVLGAQLALKISLAGLWLAIIPVTYVFLRYFEMEREPAAVGAAFMLFLDSPFGFGTGAIYSLGLLPNALAFLLSLWLLGRLRHDLQEISSYYRLTFSAVLFGLLILAHPFGAYAWALFSLFFLVAEISSRPHQARSLVGKYGFIMLGGAALSAYWWAPFIANQAHMNHYGAFAAYDRLRDFLLVKGGGGFGILVLALVGLFILGVQGRRKDIFLLLSIMVLSLLLSLNTFNKYMPFGGDLSSTHRVRFAAYYFWVFLILSVFPIAYVWRWSSKLRYRWRASILMVILLAINGAYLRLEGRFDRRQLTVNGSGDQKLKEVAAYLQTHLRSGEWVLSEDNWEARPIYGTPHFFCQQLPLLNKNIWDLGGNFPEGTRSAMKPFSLSRCFELWWAGYGNYLRQRGVRYVIATQEKSRERLIQMNFLDQVWQPDQITLTGKEPQVPAIMELRNYQTRFGLPPDLSSMLKDVRYQDPGRYELTFEKPVFVPIHTSLALSYHPWLLVKADGREIKTRPNAEYLLMLNEQVANVQTLDIIFYMPILYRCLSVFSLIMWLLALSYFLYPFCYRYRLKKSDALA